MKKELTARVGPDGVLTVTLGREEADKVVRVKVEPLEEAGRLPETHDEWFRFLERTGGSITDPTFERAPPG